MKHTVFQSKTRVLVLISKLSYRLNSINKVAETISELPSFITLFHPPASLHSFIHRGITLSNPLILLKQPSPRFCDDTTKKHRHSQRRIINVNGSTAWVSGHGMKLPGYQVALWWLNDKYDSKLTSAGWKIWESEPVSVGSEEVGRELWMTLS